jgi:8-oxo-dGTP diphosphatase
MPVSDQGIDLSRYMLIPRTLIFLRRGESVLLLKGAAHKRRFANRYNGVGGHIEPGEDILSAARREVCEETGLEPDTLALVGTIVIDTGQNPGVGVFVFRGECARCIGEPLPSEEGTLEWIDVHCLDSYPLVEDLSELLPRVLSHPLDEPPFSALYWYDEKGKISIRFTE